MPRISKEVQFDAGHRVPKHMGKCSNPHGHRYRVVAYCIGPIIDDPLRSDNGMLVDFGDLKGILMERIHDVLDHKFILWDKDDLMAKSFESEFFDDGVVIFPYVPTAENIARWCFTTVAPEITNRFGEDLRLHTIQVWETPTSMAEVTSG